MLHVIYGKDRGAGRKRFCLLRDELSKKYGEVRTVSESEITNDFFEGVASSQGLFSSAVLYVFDCVLDKKEEQELFLLHAGKLLSSSNSFLVFEPLLEKSVVGDLQKGGVTLEEFSSQKVDTRPDFNIFALGDALGKRNKKDFWILYQEAGSNGVTAEEICNTLFWAVKNLALMKNASIGDDRGISPFVAKKTREFSKNYTYEEILNISRMIVSIYHDGHRKGKPMDAMIERFILNL